MGVQENMKYVLQIDDVDVAVYESLSNAQSKCETYISRQQKMKVIAMAEEDEIAEVAWWYYDYPEKYWVKGSGVVR